MNSTASRHETFVKHCTFYNEEFLVIQYFPGDKKIYLISHFMLCVVNSMLMFPTLFLNCIAALTILKNPKLKVRASFFLIGVQSIVDAAIGVLVLPSLVYIIGSEIHGSPNCFAHFLVLKATYLFTALSVLTLCAMTIERYAGIFRPLTHRANVTNSRLTAGICAGLSWPVISLTVSLFYPRFYRISSSIGTSLFLPLVAYVYGKIWTSMKARRRAIARGVHCATRASDLSDRQKMEKETKLAKSCFLVVVCSVVCLLPMSFNSVYKNFDVFRYRVAYLWSLTLIMFNSILNSLIFFWRNPLLVKTAKSLRYA